MAETVGVNAQSPNWLGLEAPRYTSYPTAHLFSGEVNAGTHGEWLRSVREDAAVSVYIHIPFCNELCWFCGCHTKMTKRYEPIERYVRVLLDEIALLKAHTGGRGHLVNIHFGGGSPSLLEGKDLIAILEALASAFEFTSPGELAIELDPRTTTRENIALYASLGFNRISIGIQDFDPVVQQAINRIQPLSMVTEMVAQLRAVGLSHLNADLIYGLPKQTLAGFCDTLEKTILLAPQRISLFSYAHVPQVKKHQRLIATEDLPTEPQKLEIYSAASALLEANGYVAVGMDHFARAEDTLAIAMQDRSLRRNFQGYVTDATDVLIGIGASAISQFPQGYVQNSAQAVEYRTQVSAGQLPSVRGWAFKNDDRARKQVIDTLMCFMEVDLARVAAANGLAPDYFAEEVATLRGAQYQAIVAVEGPRVHLTTPYRMAVRAVASVFDRYHGVAAGRYSKVA